MVGEIRYYLKSCVLKSNKDRDECEPFSCSSFSDIESAVLESEYDKKRIIVSGEELFTKYADSLIDKSLWLDEDVLLHKCIEFVGFEPYSYQPDCVNGELPFVECEWVNWADVDYCIDQIEDGTTDVYFGELEFHCNKPDVLYNGDICENVYHPLSIALDMGLLKIDGDCIEVPVIRVSVQWANKATKEEDVKTGVCYIKSFFEFETEDIYDEYQMVIGGLRYRIKDKNMLSRMLVSYGNSYKWRRGMQYVS